MKTDAHIKIARNVSGTAPQKFGEGRRCERCGAKLSIYNGSTICQPCKSRSWRPCERLLTRKEVDKL
jgi:hypothetical protein